MYLQTNDHDFGSLIHSLRSTIYCFGSTLAWPPFRIRSHWQDRQHLVSYVLKEIFFLWIIRQESEQRYIENGDYKCYAVLNNHNQVYHIRHKVHSSLISLKIILFSNCPQLCCQNKNTFLVLCVAITFFIINCMTMTTLP